MTVELLDWPNEPERRRLLRSANKCCLLLVAGDAPPPQEIGPLEDWIRLPSDSRDIEARIACLAHRAVPSRPTLDDDGILRTSAGFVVIPGVEAQILTVMLDRFDRIADLDQLMEAGWPDRRPSRNLFDVHLHRLRRRIGPAGLEIRTVRKRGWILQTAPLS